MSPMLELVEKAKEIGKEDPRKILHSLKVGISLTLVSLFYYFNPVYDGFGVSAIWTVLTVVVVFEFSVGATIGKGLNRMLATLMGSCLGYGAHWLASHSGNIVEPILIAIFLYTFAAIVTFLRFIPKMKARYDYGLVILILTFSMISVSGYRDDEVINMAHNRVTTIIIGSATSVIICILIRPVWVGQDLHTLISSNLENLGNFLQGFGAEYFETYEGGRANNTDKSFLQAYKTILTSKVSEETMANLARWEPGHGGFKWGHPWKLYLKVGTLSRECAYKLEALNAYLNSNNQEAAVEIRRRIQEPCTIISLETGKAMKELASAMKGMKRCTILVDSHISKAKHAAEILNSQLKTELFERITQGSILEIIAVATVGSILMDVIKCVENIAKSVEEVGIEAQFEHQPMIHRGGAVRPVSDTRSNEIIIAIDMPSPNIANSSTSE